MPVMGVARFERFFRAAAGLDVDKDDLKRYSDFVAHPPTMTFGDETEARLPAIIGGLSVGLARTFKIVDRASRPPQTKHWERAFEVFDLLL